MKILYIPLDERPCNLEMPQIILKGSPKYEVITPDLELFGKKKIPANVEGMWDFIENTVQDIDAAVLSIDMLLFGGLIPSRIHNLSHEEVSSRLEKLKKLKKLNPKLKLYAFECIMRSPQYDSSEEEPDYYENYGYRLHRKAFLKDKESRVGLNKEEIKELSVIQIPEEIINDYEYRREFNLYYNLEVTKLVSEGIVDFLVIPQDDAAEFGYTAMAQKKVVTFLEENNLEQRVNIYPGADEVGASLLARCINEYLNRKTKIFAFYSSTLGPNIIPKYEDRPMHENLKYHLEVTHSYLVNDAKDADFILAINAPGKIMEEAFDQNTRDISYTSFRNLNYFVNEIERYIEQGYKVAVCDSAYSNGGDLQLIKYLDEKNLLQKLLGYAGWNTNSNTLGTVLSSSIFYYDLLNTNHSEHLIYRIIEDALYQSIVRQEVITGYLPNHGLSYYDFKNMQRDVENEIAKQLEICYNRLNVSKHIGLEKIEVVSPWSRMFEVGLRLKLKD